jgi:hypothetical protein
MMALVLPYKPRNTHLGKRRSLLRPRTMGLSPNGDRQSRWGSSRSLTWRAHGLQGRSLRAAESNGQMGPSRAGSPWPYPQTVRCRLASPSTVQVVYHRAGVVGPLGRVHGRGRTASLVSSGESLHRDAEVVRVCYATIHAFDDMAVGIQRLRYGNVS